jgi:SAM-dependent methyltransferase
VSDSGARWEQIYLERQPERLSWYEPLPEASLALIEEAAVPRDAPILDVGGGTSKLAGQLLAAGYRDVTVVDIAPHALERAREELGPAADRVTWIEADIRRHEFGPRFDLWHDRAVFHFMVEPNDRTRYVRALRRTLRAGGHLIIATFGPDGPTRCSGLPVARYGGGELSQVLGADFEFVSSRLEQHRTPGGHGQQFLYAHFRRKPDGDSQSTKQ